MKFIWARLRSGTWHAWALFDGVDTLGGICMSLGKSLPPKDAIPGPIPADEKVCQNCKYGVMGMKKRYKEAPTDG